jgi:hypothetical protein
MKYKEEGRWGGKCKNMAVYGPSIVFFEFDLRDLRFIVFTDFFCRFIALNETDIKF